MQWDDVRFQGGPSPLNICCCCSPRSQVSFARLLTLSTSPRGSLRHLISSRECAQVTTRHHATLCVSDDSYSIRQQSACSRSFLLGQPPTQPPVLHPIQSSRFKRKHSVLALICISIILPEMIKSEAPDLIFSLCISIMNSMLIFRLSLHFRMDPVELEDAAVELMGNVKKNSNLSLAFSLGGFAVIGLGFFWERKMRRFSLIIFFFFHCLLPFFLFRLSFKP